MPPSRTVIRREARSPKASDQLLNRKAIRGTFERFERWVQDTKVEESRVRIAKFQYAGRWPEEYNSWVTSETRANRYPDPDRFFRSMKAKPQWYLKKFIFKPIGGENGQYIREATIAALKIIRRQTQKYIQAPNVSGTPDQTTGLYLRQLNLMLNGKLLQSPNQLDALDNNAVAAIANVAEYATATERNALYHAKVGGILFFAAQKIKKQYPQLSIRFTFIRNSNPIFAGTGGYFSTAPVLQIGTHESLTPKMQRPRKDTYNKRTGRRRFGYKAAPNGYSS